MNKSLFSFAFLLASVILISGYFDTANALTQTSEITPINSHVGIEKSVVEFNVPADNSLPWASVEGTVSNPAPDYPVVLQIYDMDGSIEGNSVGAVHFAQIDVNSDGSFEYKFRVLDKSNNSQTNIFEGNYIVKIFKFVNLDENLNSI